ncbi:helicase-related protein [Oligosphaera ethanolica]|uniref:SNF2 family DNA or RNA helicase n=1 Tax=Oligosphaera ethanolica TaxID=760260 RepID=A0AAE3VGM9_9BACT|nr:helicase-related protein [Oligosphaera ethanolica]MDQ0290025.1 SNF2 family DNA or RNA helicase [Oligosphaera ethanolica]
MTSKLLHWKHKDNPQNEMGTLLGNEIPQCRQVDILTGYFFFDGIQNIQEALEQNKEIKLRILVGMDAGLDVKSLAYMIYEQEHRNLSSLPYGETYRKKLEEVLKHWSQEQITESQEKLLRNYSEMIEDGRLEIRKTVLPNHSKLYIFHHNDNTCSYTGGSSNFSYSGLLGRQEFNIQVMTENADEICGLFDELWTVAQPISHFTEHGKTSENPPPDSPIVEILKEKTPFSPISPFDAYMKVMREFLKLNRSDEHLDNRIRGMLRDIKYLELQYQIDAVSRAKKILDTNGGVIIADVVGLGKTVVASLLARLSDGPGVVLAPPNLIDGSKGWNSYLDKFNLRPAGWSAHSVYATDLSELPDVKNAWTVIIDEAHNLRNEKTTLYQKLRPLLHGKRVICLSATPFNNRPQDLISLIQLFGNDCIAGESKHDFIGKLDTLAKEYKGLLDERKSVRNNPEKLKDVSARLQSLAQAIKALIYPLTIRRNRLDLLQNEVYKQEVGDKIPEQKPPLEQLFQLTRLQASFYDAILTRYFAGNAPEFKGAMYHPQTYVATHDDRNAQQQQNLYSMICRFMVSRWESSPRAFRKTLDNLSGSLQNHIRVFKDYGVFVRGLDDVDEDAGEADLSQTEVSGQSFDLVLEQIRKDKKLKLIYARDEQFRALKQSLPDRQIIAMDDTVARNFLSAMEADLDVLAKIAKEFDDAGLNDPAHDAKLQKLGEVVRDILDGKIGEDSQQQGNPRKLIVFSYFADTAAYVRDFLEGHFSGKVLYADGSLQENERQEIESYFMASGKKAKSPAKMILVCTDVLSEGINLNQAGVVVNYDISYNPVRIIQRIGRINRIDCKVFDRIYSVNFFPTLIGEEISNLRSIAGTKMQMIHAILGEDACILNTDESPEKFLGSINDLDALEKQMTSDETRIDGMFRQGLAAYSPDKRKQDEFCAYLDSLGLRFTKMLGTQNSLYIFSANSAAMFVKKIDAVENSECPALPVSCLAAFDGIRCRPQQESLTFKFEEADIFWREYQAYNHGLAHMDKNAKLSKKQQEALEKFKAVKTQVPKTTGKMIRADLQFAERFLACNNNINQINDLVVSTHSKNDNMTSDNAVHLMVVGIKKEQKNG